MLQTYTKIVDWFLKKDQPGRKIAIIIGILFLFGFSSIKIYVYISELRAAEKLSTIERIAKLEKQVEDCQEIYTQKLQLEADIQDLKTSIILIKASNDNLPIPFWIKDLKGKMLYINKAFEKRYLYPRGLTASDYIGTYDSDVFTAKEAEKFRRDDIKVIEANRPLSFNENVDGRQIEVIKFPVKLGDYVYAIAGLEYVHFK